MCKGTVLNHQLNAVGQPEGPGMFNRDSKKPHICFYSSSNYSFCRSVCIEQFGFSHLVLLKSSCPEALCNHYKPLHQMRYDLRQMPESHARACEVLQEVVIKVPTILFVLW